MKGESSKSEPAIKSALERAEQKRMSRDVGVMVRTAREMAEVVAANPFADEPGNKVVAIFLDEKPPADTLDAAKNVADEWMALGAREIYVHYPSGQGKSKLRIPAAASGTARNMNSVSKMAELAEEVA